MVVCHTTGSGDTKRCIEPPAKKVIGALDRSAHAMRRSRGIPGTQLALGDRQVFSEKMTASGGYASALGGGGGGGGGRQHHQKGLLKAASHWPDKSIASSEITTFTTMDR
jgi:hypothetical protein